MSSAPALSLHVVPRAIPMGSAGPLLSAFDSSFGAGFLPDNARLSYPFSTAEQSHGSMFQASSTYEQTSNSSRESSVPAGGSTIAMESALQTLLSLQEEQARAHLESYRMQQFRLQRESQGQTPPPQQQQHQQWQAQPALASAQQQAPQAQPPPLPASPHERAYELDVGTYTNGSNNTYNNSSNGSSAYNKSSNNGAYSASNSSSNIGSSLSRHPSETCLPPMAPPPPSQPSQQPSSLLHDDLDFPVGLDRQPGAADNTLGRDAPGGFPAALNPPRQAETGAEGLQAPSRLPSPQDAAAASLDSLASRGLPLSASRPHPPPDRWVMPVPSSFATARKMWGLLGTPGGNDASSRPGRSVTPPAPASGSSSLSTSPAKPSGSGIERQPSGRLSDALQSVAGAPGNPAGGWPQKPPEWRAPLPPEIGQSPSPSEMLPTEQGGRAGIARRATHLGLVPSPSPPPLTSCITHQDLKVSRYSIDTPVPQQRVSLDVDRFRERMSFDIAYEGTSLFAPPWPRSPTPHAGAGLSQPRGTSPLSRSPQQRSPFQPPPQASMSQASTQQQQHDVQQQQQQRDVQQQQSAAQQREIQQQQQQQQQGLSTQPQQSQQQQQQRDVQQEQIQNHLSRASFDSAQLWRDTEAAGLDVYPDYPLQARCASFDIQRERLNDLASVPLNLPYGMLPSSNSMDMGGNNNSNNNSNNKASMGANHPLAGGHRGGLGPAPLGKQGSGAGSAFQLTGNPLQPPLLYHLPPATGTVPPSSSLSLQEQGLLAPGSLASLGPMGSLGSLNLGASDGALAGGPDLPRMARHSLDSASAAYGHGNGAGMGGYGSSKVSMMGWGGNASGVPSMVHRAHSSHELHRLLLQHQEQQGGMAPQKPTPPPPVGQQGLDALLGGRKDAGTWMGLASSAGLPGMAASGQGRHFGQGVGGLGGDSEVLEEAEEEELFLTSLHIVRRYRQVPFDINSINNEMRRLRPSFDVRVTRHRKFLELCRIMELKGHLKLLRVGNIVMAAPHVSSSSALPHYGNLVGRYGGAAGTAGAANLGAGGQLALGGALPMSLSKSVQLAAVGRAGAMLPSTGRRDWKGTSGSGINMRSNAAMENEVLASLLRLLCERGRIHTGELGTRLRALSPSQYGILKEQHGGLRAFLERRSDVFVVENDHPFNPHVSLRLPPPPGAPQPPPQSLPLQPPPLPRPYSATPGGSAGGVLGPNVGANLALDQHFAAAVALYQQQAAAAQQQQLSRVSFDSAQQQQQQQLNNAAMAAQFMQMAAGAGAGALPPPAGMIRRGSSSQLCSLGGEGDEMDLPARAAPASLPPTGLSHGGKGMSDSAFALPMGQGIINGAGAGSGMLKDGAMDYSGRFGDLRLNPQGVPLLETSALWGMQGGQGGVASSLGPYDVGGMGPGVMQGSRSLLAQVPERGIPGMARMGMAPGSAGVPQQQQQRDMQQQQKQQLNRVSLDSASQPQQQSLMAGMGVGMDGVGRIEVGMSACRDVGMGPTGGNSLPMDFERLGLGGGGHGHGVSLRGGGQDVGSGMHSGGMHVGVAELRSASIARGSAADVYRYAWDLLGVSGEFPLPHSMGMAKAPPQQNQVYSHSQPM